MDYRPLFNRDSYSRETISKFDILGSYFVNTFYNVLYTRAKQHRASSKNHETLTFHYKELLEKFSDVMGSSNGVTNPCKKVMKDLYEYYIDKTRFKSYTYSDFLNKITSEFLPVEFVVHISNQQKQKVFEECIVNAITSFEQKIRRKYIKNIIDDHKNTENIQLLRDIFIDCLIFQREEFYNKIAKRSTEHHIPRHIVDKLNDERNSTLEECRSIRSMYEQEKKKHEQEKKKLIHDCEQMRKRFMDVYTHVNHRNDLLKQLTTKSDKMYADLADRDATIAQSQLDLNQTQTDETDLQRNFEQLTLKSRVHDKIVAGLNENIQKISYELATTSGKLTVASKNLSELQQKYNTLETEVKRVTAQHEAQSKKLTPSQSRVVAQNTQPRLFPSPSNSNYSDTIASSMQNISSTILSPVDDTSKIDLLDAMLSESSKTNIESPPLPLDRVGFNDRIGNSLVLDKLPNTEMGLDISFYGDDTDSQSLI